MLLFKHIRLKIRYNADAKKVIKWKAIKSIHPKGVTYEVKTIIEIRRREKFL